MRVRVLFGLSSLCLLSLAGPASAHVDLIDPAPRWLGSAHGNDLKQAPCGQATNMRTATVKTYTPGQMVDIKIEEYVDHPGYYAVSFDDDGDNDFPYPRANSDDVDPATDAPMTAMPVGDKVLGYYFDKDMNCADQPMSQCTIKVKIPNVNCDNCTLQVVQFMYDKTGDNNPNEHYYQCADIKIEGPLQPGGGAGGGGAGGGGTGGAAAGSGGAGGSGGAVGGTPTGGTPTGGAAGTPTAGGAPGTAGTGTAGTSTPPAGGGTTDDGGCSVASSASQRGTALAALVGLAAALGFAARRRRSHRA
jgi:MYXO-CTERM domain-containing protein